MKLREKFAWGLFAVLFALLGIILIYSSRYYRADETATALRAQLEAEGNLTWNGSYGLLTPENANGDAIVFYSGGLVEESAYLPLLEGFRQKGYVVILPKLNFHLGFMDVNAAEPAIQNVMNSELGESIDRWYLMGHSLGGVAASMYYSNHMEQVTDIFYLASYPAAGDISEGHILYGSEDQVLKTDAFSSENIDVLILSGGNHGNFGNYGFQSGDGEATISAEQQQKQTLDFVNYMIQHDTGLFGITVENGAEGE